MPPFDIVGFGQPIANSAQHTNGAPLRYGLTPNSRLGQGVSLLVRLSLARSEFVGRKLHHLWKRCAQCDLALKVARIDL
jgi:hypothetical protein